MSQTFAHGVAEWLALAAAPTFAAMALASGLWGDRAMGALCHDGPGFPLSGMSGMYLLMSAFHLSPWLRRAARPVR